MCDKDIVVIKPAGEKEGISNEKKYDIFLQYKHGASYDEISKWFGCDIITVASIVGEMESDTKAQQLLDPSADMNIGVRRKESLTNKIRILTDRCAENALLGSSNMERSYMEARSKMSSELEKFQLDSVYVNTNSRNLSTLKNVGVSMIKNEKNSNIVLVLEDRWSKKSTSKDTSVKKNNIFSDYDVQ